MNLPASLLGLVGLLVTTTAGAQSVAPARSLSAHNSLNGATGLLRVDEAGSGPAGTFRASFLGGYYAGSGFLCDGSASGGCARVQTTPEADQVSRYSMRLSLSGTPLPFLEAHLGGSALVTSDDQSRPKIVQVVGNPALGIKVFLPERPGRVFRIGAQGDLWLPSSSGSTGIDASAASFALRALTTVDLSAQKGAARPTPLRMHLNLSYVFDNSSALVSDGEAERGRPIERIRRFELGINRLDRLELALGVEGVFQSVRPFLEWSLDVPVARQTYRCSTSSLEPGDLCLKSADFSAQPSRLGLGARWLTPLRGLALTAAFELGTGGTRSFSQELTPELPWNSYLAIGYALDTVPPPPVVKRVEVQTVRVVETPVALRSIVGKVVDGKSAQPVASAVVRYDSAGLSSLVTSEDGSFKTGKLEPGTYVFNVTAEGYEPGQCEASVPAAASGQQPKAPAPPAIELTCTVQPMPKVAKLSGLLFDSASGVAVANAKVTAQDQAGRAIELFTNNSGAFRFENVPFGRIQIQIEAPGYLRSVSELDVQSRELEPLRVRLNPRPKRSTVTISAKELKTAKPIRFEPGSSTLLPGSEAELEELGELLRSKTELLIEIRGYVDDTGALLDALRLSQQRADVVRAALIRLGVEGARLSAKGAGEAERAPANAAAADEARRVHFAIALVAKPR